MAVTGLILSLVTLAMSMPSPGDNHLQDANCTTHSEEVEMSDDLALVGHGLLQTSIAVEGRAASAAISGTIGPQHFQAHLAATTEGELVVDGFHERPFNQLTVDRSIAVVRANASEISSGTPLKDATSAIRGMASIVGATGEFVGSTVGVVGSVFGQGNAQHVAATVENMSSATATSAWSRSAVAQAAGSFTRKGDKGELPEFVTAGTTGSMANVNKSAGSTISGLAEVLAPSVLGGHALPEINMALVWIVLAIVTSTGVGFLLPKISSRFEVREGRPSPWVFGLLISSYALLIPGIVEVLFSFLISFSALGFEIDLELIDQDGPGATTETMIGFIKLLFDSGGALGAVMVIFYAMVVPFIKLFLIVIGEWWRFDVDPAKVNVARGSLLVVQLISKWACPDMFAYILLLYLVRSVGEKTDIINTRAQLDTGFLCFSIFCIASTFSSLFVELPQKQAGDESKTVPLLIRTCGRRGAPLAVTILVLVFAGTFSVGLLSPVLALRLDVDLLEIPAPLKLILKELNLESLLKSDVSVIRCLSALGHWVWRGEASCILAFAMFAIFVVGLVLLDMALLLIAAAGIGVRREHQALEETSGASAAAEAPGLAQQGSLAAVKIEGLGSRQRSLSISAAHVIRHLCMLDVFVMAVLIISFAVIVYRSVGLIITVREGAWWLLAAEVTHVFTFYSVQSAVYYVEEEDSRALSKQCVQS